MSAALAERVVMMLLTDTESLEFLVREGLNLDIVPTGDFREVISWALDYYRQGGAAPTPAVVKGRHGSVFEDSEIDPEGDVEETLEWALDTLKAQYILNQSSKFTRRMAVEVAQAPEEERFKVLVELQSDLTALVLGLSSRREQVDLRVGGQDILASYQRSVESRGAIQGMAFGLPQVDQYLGGTLEGELTVVGAGPKTGKSQFLASVAHAEWSGRNRVVGLFTLENSIRMTQYRLACIALHIPYTDLMNGTLDERDFNRLTEWVYDVLEKADTPLHIFAPPFGQRDPHSIVQTAHTFGCDDVVIDQLSFLEPGSGKERRYDKRNTEVARILRDLTVAINEGRRPLPCLLAHQISREGIKEADKSGHVPMTGLADSSEVERVATTVVALYASEDQKALGQMMLEVIAARRVGFPKAWDMTWQPGMGIIHVRNQVVFDE